MKLDLVQQQAIQARMNLIVGATTFDRLFLGATFDEVADKILYVFAHTEKLAAEIEEKYALHLSIVARQITGRPVEFVQVLPERLRQCDWILTDARLRRRLPRRPRCCGMTSSRSWPTVIAATCFKWTPVCQTGQETAALREVRYAAGMYSRRRRTGRDASREGAIASPTR